jgi:hypothetical protein
MPSTRKPFCIAKHASHHDVVASLHVWKSRDERAPELLQVELSAYQVVEGLRTVPCDVRIQPVVQAALESSGRLSAEPLPNGRVLTPRGC